MGSTGGQSKEHGGSTTINDESIGVSAKRTVVPNDSPQRTVVLNGVHIIQLYIYIQYI